MKSNLSSESLVSAAPNRVSSSVEDEVVILDLDAGVYYGLNSVGAWVWDSIQEPRRVADLQREVLERFDVERTRAERELMELLHELARAGLIEVA
jgi:hypothetical protein